MSRCRRVVTKTTRPATYMEHPRLAERTGGESLSVMARIHLSKSLPNWVPAEVPVTIGP
jgi:hypothetical protein